MRLKQIGKGLALAAGLLLSACTNDGEMEWQEGAPTTADSSMGTVTFQIAGLPSTSTLRAEGTDPEDELDGIQTPKESQVQHLVAVLFEGSAGQEEIGETQEENTAKFVKAMDVFVGSADEGMRSGVDYSLPIDKDVSYTVCFIANPGNNLLMKIKESLQAGVSTISALKALVEYRDPNEYPKMMTSAFYHLYLASNKENVSLGAVKLTRSMARIDIINRASGVAITKVEFKNQATQSVVMLDNSVSWNLETARLTDKTYERLAFEEVSTAASTRTGTEQETYSVCRSQIYSYENLETSGDKAPKLVLYYKIGESGTEKTEEVEFKYTGDSSMPVKRNTRYNIIVTSQGEAGLNVYVQVADWNTVDLDVPKADLVTGVVSLGDYLMKNGQFISSSTTLTEDQKANVIGVVFYVTSDIEDDKLGVDVKNYLRANPSHSLVHGKAISLKNYSQGSGIYRTTWATSENDAFSQQYDEVTQAIQDLNGYGNSQFIWERGSGSYPAFACAQAYRETNAYEDFVNTGWYLPSEGEFLLLNTELAAVENALVALGADAESLYGETYWSSSERNGSQAWTYYLPSSPFLPWDRYPASNKRVDNTLRFVIAF